jgi:hypothetical protein
VILRRKTPIIRRGKFEGYRLPILSVTLNSILPRSQMGCGCSDPNMINSWDDIQKLVPMNPMDLIANAQFGATQGAYLNSTNYIAPGTWATATMALSSEATVSTLAGDQLVTAANAAQWNFSHQTVNTISAVAPPLRKRVFLRAGTMWQNAIPISIGPDLHSDLQLSFLDNAATRGDYAGTVPVIWFNASFSGNTNSLVVTLNTTGRAEMGLRALNTNTGNYEMFEMEWIVVP